MSKRTELISDFYTKYDEDTRLLRSRRGQMEYFTTMEYIHRYADKDSKILEIGAGTGRYSITLAKEGMNVTAVELVSHNLDRLRKNSEGIKNISVFQGDGTDLSRFANDSFDLTLVFGPMYHLYERTDVDRAINEAIRLTKPSGYVIFAFLSVYAIMFANYMYGNWAEGEKENFDENYRVLHFEEQMFTGYDITEFEDLFKDKAVQHVTTVGTDGILETLQKNADFSITDADFEAFKKWHLAFAEKRELLGATNHLLYICKKKC